MSSTKQATHTNAILGAFTVLSVAGLAGLIITPLAGFEEPASGLLLVSSVLTLAAPIATLVHLSVTKELTRHEKGIWMRQLTGPRAPRVFSMYLTSRDRSAVAERFAAEATK